MRAKIALAGALAMTAMAAAAVAEPYVATAPDPDRQLAAVMELYDAVCLRAFPDDVAVATAMAARGAVALDAAEVRERLHDDPGVGWRLDAAGARLTVTVEAPPYHACAVRTMTAGGFPDLAPYAALLRDFGRTHGRLTAMAPMTDDRDGIHTTLSAVSRATAGGGSESLMMLSGSLTDEALRKEGQTAIEVRFVHQIVMPAGSRAERRMPEQGPA